MLGQLSLSRIFLLVVSLVLLGGCGGGGGQGEGEAGDGAGNASGVALTQISISSSNSQVSYGQTLQLTATALFSDGRERDVSSQVEWVSRSSLTATVNETGLLSGDRVGVAEIVASMGGVSGSASLTVVSELLAIAVSAADTELLIGGRVQLAATGIYSDNIVRDISDLVTWGDNASSVIDVDSTGVVNATTSGSGQISATVGGISSNIRLTVSGQTITSIAVTPSQNEIPNGASQQLVAIALLGDGSYKDVTSQAVWSSGSNAVATVSKAGVVTSLDAGSTTVSASINGVSGGTSITVSSAMLDLIQVTPGGFSLTPDAPRQIHAVGLYSNGRSADLTDGVTWESQDESVLMVRGGEASPKSIGSTSVNASLDGVTGSANVSTADVQISSLEIYSGETLLAVGGGIPLQATAVFEDGSRVDVTESVVWSSSDDSIATAGNGFHDHGVVSAVSTGAVVISAAFYEFSNTVTLQVTEASLTNIDVNSVGTLLIVGNDQAFTATGHYDDGSTRDISDRVQWGSSNSSLAELVDVNGSFRGVADSSGEMLFISAKMDDLVGFSTLEVSDGVLESIEINADSNALVNEMAQRYTATGHYQGGATQDLTGMVTWFSSDENVALISNAGGEKGLATAVGSGSSIISASFDGLDSNELTLAAGDEVLTDLTVEASRAGDYYVSQSIELIATAHFSDGSTQDVTDKVVWNSSDSSIAKVSNAAGSEGVGYLLSAGPVQLVASLEEFQHTVDITIIDDPNFPASISITSTPGVMLNNNSDVTIVDVVVRSLGSDGTPAGKAVDITVTSDEPRLLRLVKTNVGGDGTISYGFSSVHEGFIFFEVSVKDSEVTETIKIYSTSTPSSAPQ